MLLSDTIVDFHLFYDGAVDIQIWASQCKVSDTQVTVKACGPLVNMWNWFCLQEVFMVLMHDVIYLFASLHWFFKKIIILNLPFLECTWCIHGHAKISITIVLIKAYYLFFLHILAIIYDWIFFTDLRNMYR